MRLERSWRSTNKSSRQRAWCPWRLTNLQRCIVSLKRLTNHLLFLGFLFLGQWMIGSLIIASEKRRWTFSYSLPESTLMKLLHATKLFLKRFKAVLTNQHFKNEVFESTIFWPFDVRFVTISCFPLVIIFLVISMRVCFFLFSYNLIIVWWLLALKFFSLSLWLWHVKCEMLDEFFYGKNSCWYDRQQCYLGNWST